MAIAGGGKGRDGRGNVEANWQFDQIGGLRYFEAAQAGARA
jgi:hypothetical protein